jgi:L-threonylcarbamoyladenylate synthase
MTTDQVNLAIRTLNKGGVVAFPTDTVYGLGASFLDEEAVEKIYIVKRRARGLPIPLLLSEESQLDEVARRVPEIARRLARRFWPGALTLVLPKSPSVPDAVTAGGDTVAVRIPDHPIAISLIRGLGVPLAATSANISGGASPVTAEDVRSQLGGEVDLIIDGGRCRVGVESTVIDVTGETPTILREGAISRDEIADICDSCSRDVGQE